MVKEAEEIANKLYKTGREASADEILLSIAVTSKDPKKIVESARRLAKVDPWNPLAYRAAMYDPAIDNNVVLKFAGAALNLYSLYSDEDEEKKDIEKIIQTWMQDSQKKIDALLKERETGQEAFNTSLRLIVLYLDTKDYAKAEEECKKALNLAKSEDEKMTVKSALRKVYLKQGKYQEALKISKEIAVKFPENEVAYAYDLLLTGEIEKAEEILVRLARSEEKDVCSEALLLLSQIAAEKTDYFRGHSLAKKAVEADPSNSAGRLNLAISTMATTFDLKKALEHVEKARDIDPFDPYIAGTLAFIYLNSVNLVEARKWENLYARLSGDDYDGWHVPGFLALYEGLYKEAEPYFLEEISRGGDVANSFGGLVVSYYKLGDERYKYWLERFINEPHATNDEVFYWMLGELAEQDGDREKAVNYYRSAVSICPGFGIAKQRLSKLGVSPKSRKITEDDRMTATLDVMRRIQ